jgi:hypothetical protein
MDELEKFIRDHRQDLDRYSPAKKTWSGIRSGLGNKSHFSFYSISAAAVIIFAISLTALLMVNKYRFIGVKKYEAVINNNTTLKETELYYNNLAHEIFMEAKPFLMENPDLEKELITDLSQLDSICIELKKDLKDNISNQEVIEALINNYRTKILILTEMLDLLQQEEPKDLNTNGYAL